MNRLRNDFIQVCLGELVSSVDFLKGTQKKDYL